MTTAHKVYRCPLCGEELPVWTDHDSNGRIMVTTLRPHTVVVAVEDALETVIRIGHEAESLR